MMCLVKHPVWQDAMQEQQRPVEAPAMLIREIAWKAGMSKDGIRHYEAPGLMTSVPGQAGSRT